MARFAPLIWMLLAPPIVAVTYMTADYLFGITRTTSTDYVAIVVALLVGILAWRRIGGSTLAKTILLIAYVPLMVATLFRTMLMTACAYGDCL